MTAEPSFPERSLAIRRATALLCLRLGWSPVHEVPLPNARRADILALRADGGFACIEVKSGLRDFQTDRNGRNTATTPTRSTSPSTPTSRRTRCRKMPV